MDPNANLAEIRSIVRGFNEPENPQNYAQGFDGRLSVLVELIEALDEWLSKGGFLPSGWGPENPEKLATITYRYGDKEVTAYVPPF